MESGEKHAREWIHQDLDITTMDKARNIRKGQNRNYEGSNLAFTQAIRDKNVEMMNMLLENDLNMGCALFHAIQHNSSTAVRIICEHLQPSKLELETKLNSFCDDEEFPRYTTPLLYASSENQLDIVKILIAFGAEFPGVDAIVSRAGPEHYDIAVARLYYHKALSSEAYLLATPDPIESAFEVGKKIKAFEQVQIPSFRKDYRAIKRNLDIFASKLLMQVDGTQEIQLFLSGSVAKQRDKRLRKSEVLCKKTPVFYDSTSTLPKRVQDAIKLEYKQFLVNSNCQQFIVDKWFRGRSDWQTMPLVSFAFWTLLVMICNPLLNLLYIFVPLKCVQSAIKAPYVRFLLDFTSRTGFVLLLLEYTVHWVFVGKSMEEYDVGVSRMERYMDYRANPPERLTLTIYLMITGMTWREIKEIYFLGPLVYLKELFNWVDICQLTCFWISIILDIIDITDNKLRLDEQNQYFNQSQFNESMANVSIDTQLNIDLQFFDIFDTLLISEAAFAIATVLTFLRLLRDAVILKFVGPLLVSFVGMISDIARFLLIFVFVWVSFGIGLTQLYDLEAISCREKTCNTTPFASLLGTMSILFWSLFGPTDLDNFRNYNDMFLTETVGVILYGAYMVIVVVVMVNALIAMMSNTYTRVEENSEVEWKLFRTKIMTAYMTNSPTLPPPYNLVPTVKTLLWILSCASFRVRRYSHNIKKDASDTHTTRNNQEKYKGLIRLATDRYISDLGYISKEEQDQDQIKTDMTMMKDFMNLIREELKEIRAQTSESQRQVIECSRLQNELILNSSSNKHKGKHRFPLGKR